MKTIKYLAAIIFFMAASALNAEATDVHAALNNVVKSYLAIKNALATDNSKAANDEAKKFTAALKEVQCKPDGCQAKRDMDQICGKTAFDGEHIGESTAIAHQREHFGTCPPTCIPF